MNRFRTFMMGGFECADHINRSGERVDMLRETGHSRQVREDYRLLTDMGIYTVREGIAWSSVEQKPGIYDFSEVRNRIDAANAAGIQQIWDICHFGYPDGLVPTYPGFDDRFANVCRAFAEFYKAYSGNELFVVPVNEISFLAWHSGEVRGTVPFAINSGFDIKYHLCKAAIKGIQALKEADPSCTIVMTEPLIHIHAGDETQHETAHRLNEEQFQALDMLAGYLCPELGGRPEYLDILGFNYYYNNQWVHDGRVLDWEQEWDSLKEVSALLYAAHRRYGRPLVLAETGHFGANKEAWIYRMAEECKKAMERGVDLYGICIYPVLDRPDWDNLSQFSNCGMWSLDTEGRRIKDEAYCKAISDCMSIPQELNIPAASRLTDKWPGTV